MRYVVLIAALFTVACTSGAERYSQSRATTWRHVAAWTGRGTSTLETFPIGAGRLRIYWEVRRESPSPPDTARFHVSLHSADSGRVLDDVVQMTGAGAGSREIVDDHQRFYLSVDSTSVEWTIRVEEGLAASR